MTEQLDMFSIPDPIEEKVTSRDIQVPGLEYVADYIAEDEARSLESRIDHDEGVWIHDLKRRVQHYGYKYDYKARRIDKKMHLGELPSWGKDLACKLHSDGYFEREPDQIIVNEYLPKQGIAKHTDCVPCFDDTIASLSLLNPVVMDFFANPNTKQKSEILLAPRSLIVLKGVARHKWLHGIRARVNHEHAGEIYPLKRRISLTFRSVILDGKH